MSKIRLYVGDRRDPFVPGRYQESTKAFGEIQRNLSAKSLSFLHQTHSCDGYVCAVAPSDAVRFLSEGDFLVTNTPGAAIGVLTADCLPIVLHDKKNGACGVVHAGWRGSVKGITVHALGSMYKNFGTDPGDIDVYFGPAAGRCCYEVGGDFRKNVSDRHAGEVVVEKSGRFYFDNCRLNMLQLLDVGVFERNFFTRYNTCTICGGLHHSYRRDGNKSKRQATVVVLSKSKGLSSRD